MILEHFGFRYFGTEEESILHTEALRLSSKRLSLSSQFRSIVDFCKEHRITIPRYHKIGTIILESFREYSTSLLSLLESNLSDTDRELLDALLAEIPTETELKRCQLTHLRRYYHALRPVDIRENSANMRQLQSLFFQLKPLIERLNLTPEIIEHYAHVVIKLKLSQLHDRVPNKRYLLLITFVIYHYYHLTDLLFLTFQKSVQKSLNGAKNRVTIQTPTKEKVYAKDMKKASLQGKEVLDIFDECEKIMGSPFSSDEKVAHIDSLLKEQKELRKEALHSFSQIDKTSDTIETNNIWYEALTSESLALQNRVSDIIRVTIFDKEYSSPLLLEAVHYFQKHDGSLYTPPISFLSKEAQKQVYVGGKLQKSLYKILLFQHIHEAYKEGTINLFHSHTRKAYNHYLIPPIRWKKEEDLLLKQAQLSHIKEWKTIEKILRKKLSQKFEEVNQRIINKENSGVVLRNTSYYLKTASTDAKTEKKEALLFPENDSIPIMQVLSLVQEATHFLDHFNHFQKLMPEKRPDDSILLATIGSYAFNLGIGWMAQSARNIDGTQLENCANWYLTLENIEQANNAILKTIDEIELSDIFLSQKDQLHTSSDGKKVPLAVESIHGNRSYKDFGNAAGINIYSFIDEKHKFFHSMVIESTEREAAYLIDGLMHNDVVQSSIHSTDTHGYTEIIFALTYLLGIDFAPRIKNVQKQLLYSFEKPKFFDPAYLIRPKHCINTVIISEQWDAIVQMVTTIKLKETSASQLLTRLNSYAKKHPLYKALQELGKIIKTSFILGYIDSEEERQAIQKQLNKSESAHRIEDAISYGHGGASIFASKEEQLIADGCRRLVQNAIICMNYIYLSQKIIDTTREEEKEGVRETVKKGSIVIWEYINMHGEFDLDPENLKSPYHFDLKKIIKRKEEFEQ